jgi:hypothetical protein
MKFGRTGTRETLHYDTKGSIWPPENPEFHKIDFLQMFTIAAWGTPEKVVA